MIPYFRLQSNKHELEALIKIHAEGTWAVGSSVDDVKANLSELFGKKEVVLTSSGYSALFISIKALNISGQKIILPCLGTCFAIGNAITASGNIPVFCDINPQDGNCDPFHVKQLVKEQRIQYIISPNYAGNISAVSYFKNELGLTVIEDACQSFFSSQEKDSEADVTVFSFYPTKGINGIDGGAIITRNKEVAKKAEQLVYYNDQLVFEADERFNFRFLNINASVLRANLNRKEETIKKLNHVKQCYDAVLKNKTQAHRLSNIDSIIAQRYVVSFNEEGLKQKAMSEFKERGIAMPLFYAWNCDENSRTTFKNAEILVGNCFCIPYFEDLTEVELNIIVKSMNDVFA